MFRLGLLLGGSVTTLGSGPSDVPSSGHTHRLLSSSFFLGLPYGILSMNHKKELLRSLWVEGTSRKFL